MLAALAQGFQVLEDRRYYEAAARGARFLLSELFREDRLYRSWKEGQLSVPGFCDDYAHLAYGLLELYEADFNPAWLEAARRLVEQLDELFLDPESGLYFYVARDQEAPLVRARSFHDQTLPSGSSMAARVCLKLHRITEESRCQERALGILQALQAQARENPWVFAHLLTVQALSPHPAGGPDPGGRPRRPRDPGPAPGSLPVFSAGAPPAPEKSRGSCRPGGPGAGGPRLQLPGRRPGGLPLPPFHLPAGPPGPQRAGGGVGEGRRQGRSGRHSVMV